MSAMLLPPAPGLCYQCAVDHPAHYPHNLQSLYYCTRFQMQHGRSPTWADAVAHCTQEMQDDWLEKLDEIQPGTITPAVREQLATGDVIAEPTTYAS